jgi:hypothetical protein
MSHIYSVFRKSHLNYSGFQFRSALWLNSSLEAKSVQRTGLQRCTVTKIPLTSHWDCRSRLIRKRPLEPMIHNSISGHLLVQNFRTRPIIWPVGISLLAFIPLCSVCNWMIGWFLNKSREVGFVINVTHIARPLLLK